MKKWGSNLSYKKRKFGEKGPHKKNSSSDRKPKFNRPAKTSPNEEVQDFKEFGLDNQTLKKSIALTEQKVEQWLEESIALKAKPYHPPANPMDEMDPWQKQSVDHLFAKHNVIVDAPTTAGKTRVIEAYFAMHINDPGFRACYTCPVKSLSNDKVKEFREMFGADKVGIATGDLKENLDAPIVVATLETYRNSLLGVEPDLDRMLVVFDEYHYLMDIGRGSAWEEAIILTPPSCQILMLSASISNAEDFRLWLEKIHSRECKLIEVSHRPVPLTDLIYTTEQWLVPDLIPDTAYKNLKKKSPIPLTHDKFAARIVKIDEIGLTPTIVYCGKRLSCELLAETIASHMEPLDKEKSLEIGRILQEVHQENNALSFIKPQMRRMIQSYGVAYHHSGLGPPARIAIEALLKKGLLKFCTATMGLSLGINFSVRSAVISDYVRPGDNGLTTYGPSEVLQMLGRAGRRGHDVIGFSLWPNLQSYAIMGKPRRERCESKLKNDPTTFLGLLSRGYTLHDIEKFYKRSFMHFKDSSIDLTLIDEFRLKKKIKANPPCESPVGELVLMKKGLDSLCTECKFRKACHGFIAAKQSGALCRLHSHLHEIEAIDRHNKLTAFGNIGKHFPHDGGLLVAQMIANNEINEDNLISAAQLFASFSMARFKAPQTSTNYKFPWKPSSLEKKLEKFYPLDLFPELYDPPYGNRTFYVLKSFNPKAGYIIDLWLKGGEWNDLLQKVTTEKVAPGDVSSLIYRVASYFQSLAQVNLGKISEYAGQIRDDLVREPLSFKL